MPAHSSSDLTVAVQGERGCNSELAAYEYCDGAQRLEIAYCASFEDLFVAVADGRARFAMAPVENSIAGGVHPAWDLLLEYRPHVAGELYLRIAHCLITHPDTEVRSITDVYSHPQALAQCAQFLESLEGVAQHEAYDTAGAVKMIAERGAPGEAAIAPALAAGDYGMKIAATAIESEHENYTRFLVLSGEPAVDLPEAGEGLRATVLAPLDDRARRLPELLTCLTGRGIEIEKVECVHRLGRPWSYMAFVDYTAQLESPDAAAALTEMRAISPDLCHLGPYAPGPRAEPRSVRPD